VRAEGQAPSSDPPDELGGSVLRLLHQLASATSAAEALARTSPPAAPTLMAAMGWGMAGSALALETLQRALTLANRARDSLVGSALGAGLVQVLLQRLDWRSGSGADADNQVPQDVFLVNPFAEGGRSCCGLCKGSCPPGQPIAIPSLLLQAGASFPCMTVIPGHADSHMARLGLDMLDCSVLQSHTLCHLPAGKMASPCLHLESCVTNLPYTLS